MKTLKTITRHLLMSAAVLFTATSVLHAATTDALPQAPGPRCAKPVFYAQTVNHKKEVEICIVTPSVSYSFGKVGAKNKEMDITVPAGNTIYAYQSNQVISIQNFTVRMAIPAIRSQQARMMPENHSFPFMYIRAPRRPASSLQR